MTEVDDSEVAEALELLRIKRGQERYDESLLHEEERAKMRQQMNTQYLRRKRSEDIATTNGHGNGTLPELR